MNLNTWIAFNLRFDHKVLYILEVRCGRATASFHIDDFLQRTIRRRVWARTRARACVRPCNIYVNNVTPAPRLIQTHLFVCLFFFPLRRFAITWIVYDLLQYFWFFLHKYEWRAFRWIAEVSGQVVEFIEYAVCKYKRWWRLNVKYDVIMQHSHTRTHTWLRARSPAMNR